MNPETVAGLCVACFCLGASAACQWVLWRWKRELHSELTAQLTAQFVADPTVETAMNDQAVKGMIANIESLEKFTPPSVSIYSGIRITRNFKDYELTMERVNG